MSYGEVTSAPDEGAEVTQVPGARVFNLPTGVITASKQLTTRPGQVMGWVFTETTGSAAGRVRLRDGTDTTGTVIAPVGIPQGNTVTVGSADPGTWALSGVYVEVVSGSVEGTVYYRYF